MADLPLPLPRPWRPGGTALKRVLIAGIRRVLSRRDAINRINVFPVADGDTGSNLAFTLSAVERALAPLRRLPAGALLRRAGDEAIDGARGNSGAILAQFLQGLGERLAAQRRVALPELAAAATFGAEQARLAVAQPREGTMLSVITAFAAALRREADVTSPDLRECWSRVLAAARDALARTPEQLAVLRKAGVVDAGAQGFVELLEGIDDYMRRGRDALLHADECTGGESGIVGADPVEPGHDAEHRWCTECVLSAAAIDRAAVQGAIGTLPHSSLVLAGTREKLRVHVHVDAPQWLYDVLAPLGDVRARKADDMQAQARSARTRSRVAVVVDSAADLPPDAFERWPLHLVPVRLNFGSRDFLDKVSLSPAEFFRELRTSPVAPRTSQPPPGDFRRLFDFLLSHHDEVVYVGLSRAVSGTLQSGESAAARSASSRIRVIDTRNASCGQGLLACYAASLAAQGLGADDIVARVASRVPHTRLFAYVRDLSHAVRGGRIPAWGLPLTRWFGLVPVVALGGDGRLRLTRVMRAHALLPERFAAWTAARLPPGRRWRVLVGDADNAFEADRLAMALNGLLVPVSTERVEAGAAISAHAGPGAVVVAFMPENEGIP